VGDVVAVKRGYARNYLFPKKMAARLTKENLEAVEVERHEILAEQERLLSVAQQRAKTLDGVSIALSRIAKEDGSLFGAVGATDIVNELSAQGHEVKRAEVLFTQGEIKSTGEFAVSLRFHPKLTLELPVKVTAEEEG
jgi:large subunit ribosomal protein L9